MRPCVAIDPGTRQSAWLFWDGTKPVNMGIEDNENVLKRLRNPTVPVVIEMVASYGMAVGKDVFETVFWIGRFWQTAHDQRLALKEQPEHARIFRTDVKMHLCHSTRAKDANIRQALIDRFPATGGGRVPQIGTKSNPGPLYGVKSHLWAALGVAVTYSDRCNEAIGAN